MDGTPPADTTAQIAAKEFAKSQAAVVRVMDPNVILGRSKNRLVVNGDILAKGDAGPVKVISFTQKGFGPGFDPGNLQSMIRLRTDCPFGPEIVGDYVDFKGKNPFGVVRAGLNARYKRGPFALSLSYLPITYGFGKEKPNDEFIANVKMALNDCFALNGFARIDPNKLGNSKYGMELSGKGKYFNGAIGGRVFNGEKQFYIKGTVPVNHYAKKIIKYGGRGFRK